MVNAVKAFFATFKHMLREREIAALNKVIERATIARARAKEVALVAQAKRDALTSGK